jgi:hypothetical protein
MIRYYSTFLVLFVMILIGCASTAQLPATLNIVPPSSDLPPEIAAFSGIWEGKWRGYTDVILVVENINTQKAEIIYSVGANYIHDSCYTSYTAVVSSGHAIEWTKPNGDKYVFEMDKGFNKINGFFIEKETGSKHLAFLHRRVVK